MAGAGVFALVGMTVALVWAAGCRERIDGMQAVVDRHRHAIGHLPEEQRRLLRSDDSLRDQGDPEEPVLSPGPLTLSHARRAALRGNPDVRAAHARLSGALSRIAEARARYYPTLTFTHTSTRTFHTPASRNRLNTALQPSQPTPEDLNTNSFAVTALINALRRPLLGYDKPIGNRNSFSEHSTAFTASWILFDGFVREAQLLATKHLYQAAGASLADLERLIAQAIDAAYYQVQLAEEQLRIARADEAFSQEQLDETGKLRDAGRATQADVDNFRVRVLAAQANVTEATGLLETGRVVLAELIGVPGPLPNDVILVPLSDETAEEMTTPDPDPWIARALSNRPDIVQLEHLVRGSHEDRRATEGLYLPTVAISGSWGYDSTSTINYSVQDQSSAAVLEFRWDLFTGGARRARVHIAQSAVVEAEASLDRLKLAVGSQVRRAIIDLRNAQTQIRLQRETLETTRENRRIIQARYVAGKETLTRLNEAQRDYITADADLALARIRMRLAWSDLQAAASKYEETTGLAPVTEPVESAVSPTPGVVE